jgi:hypothetical protein
MNPLERSLIEKAGYANGWENVRESMSARVGKPGAPVLPRLASGAGVPAPTIIASPSRTHPDRLSRHLVEMGRLANLNEGSPYFRRVPDICR